MSGLKSYGMQPLPPAPSAESVPAGVAGSPLTRIMQQVARFCMRVDQARYGNPIDGIGVKPLAVQRVWC
jgi:hypothetical protein